MTRFSKKIEELIDESGETVQSLAEMGKINRTTLQRIKSGGGCLLLKFLNAYVKRCVCQRLKSKNCRPCKKLPRSANGVTIIVKKLWS